MTADLCDAGLLSAAHRDGRSDPRRLVSHRRHREDGQRRYFYLLDRAKDMINVAGFKVWPREVEEVVLQHPSVSEVAVGGIADSVSGEAVKAFAVLKQGQTVGAQELIDFGRARMDVYKAPQHVEFIDALPKTPSGKTLKRELRAREQQGQNAAKLKVA